MKTTLIAIFQLLIVLSCLSQVILPAPSEMYYTQFNVASPYKNRPYDIIKSNDSTYYAFLHTGICPSLSVRKIVNNKLTVNQIFFGDAYKKILIKQKDKLWLAIAQIQYIDDVGGSEEIFIREENDAIVSNIGTPEGLNDKTIYIYSDFTFLNDSILLCLPSHKQTNREKNEYKEQMFLTNLNGEIIDSIANTLPQITKIEKIENGFICSSEAYLYKVDNEWKILDSIATQSTRKIIAQKNTFYTLSNDSKLSVYTIDNLEKKLTQEKVSDEVVSNQFLYYSKSNVIHEINLNSFVDSIVFVPISDNSFDPLQFAIDNNNVVIGGSSTSYERISEFRSYNLTTENTKLNDLSITMKMDSFLVDTLFVHIFGSDTFIEYDNKGYFSYEITNKGSQTVIEGIVYSQVLGGINCSEGFHSNKFFNVKPDETAKYSGSVTIRGGLSYNLCLYIPSNDNKPDEFPEDNKSCALLSATTPEVDFSNDIAIAPNPATDKIEILCNYTSSLLYEVFDTNGVKIVASKSSTIDVSALASGIYFLKAVTPKGAISVKKFVKM